jgi:hypothetical protein
LAADVRGLPQQTIVEALSLFLPEKGKESPSTGSGRTVVQYELDWLGVAKAQSPSHPALFASGHIG